MNEAIGRKNRHAQFLLTLRELVMEQTTRTNPKNRNKSERKQVLLCGKIEVIEMRRTRDPPEYKYARGNIFVSNGIENYHIRRSESV